MSFWNQCPRHLDFLPETACPLGKISADTGEPDKGCPWFINSAQDNYCFWKWMRRVSDKEGFMEPLMQHEISEFLCHSSTKIHAIYKEAIIKIQEHPEYEELKLLFKE